MGAGRTAQGKFDATTQPVTPTRTTMISESRAGVAAEPLLHFLIRIALALLTALAKKRSIGPQCRLQNQNSTSYTTRHEYQEGLCVVRRCTVDAITTSASR